MSFYVKLLIALYVTVATGAPSHSTIYADDNVQKYLMSFGYLPESDRETASLRTEDQLINAIKDLQSYGGIPVTGEIDSATRKLMASPRCGLADKPDPRFSRQGSTRYNYGEKRRQKRYSIHGHHWKHHNLTWSLKTAPHGLDTGGVRSVLSRALDLWARNSKLTFQELNSDSADILVSFRRGYHDDGYPFDGRGQILAHAFFPGQDRGGDAHFDEEEIWLLEDEPSSEGTSLYAVAAHEFGHSLGLGHSSEQGALMYPWYQGLSNNYELPDDDKHGIQQMYGAPQGKLWGPYDSGRRYQPRTTTTTTTTTTTHRPWRTHPNIPSDDPHRRKTYYPQKPGRTHRPRYWTTTTVSPKKSDVPETCDTSYDAVTMIRRELFIFKGRYFWRIDTSGVLSGYPVEMTRFFNFPSDIDHVDAVYERPDKKIVFFIGRYYYIFNANRIETGPRPITDLGLPATINKIDGAMIWGHNGRTYFFSGTMYWRFDEDAKYIELDYPRDMSMFAGVGYNIDSVFQWTDGKTYFFKGKGFWEFNDLRMRVVNDKQRLSARFWMHCTHVSEVDGDDSDNLPRGERVVSGVQKQPFITTSSLIAATVIILRLS